MQHIKDKLKQEIEEMEKAMNPVEPTKDPEAPSEDPVEVKVDNPEVTPEAVEKPKRTNWKKKYEEANRRMAGLKASTDSFKVTSRKEISDLKEQVAQLAEQVSKAPTVDPFADVFTPEDMDTIGSEAVEVIKKATDTAAKSQVNPLKEELKRLKEEAMAAKEAQVKAEAQSTYDAFLNRLATLVPNWESINNDPEFIKYLDGVDDASGYPRMTIFRNAEQSNDVGRVAQIMKDYSATPEDKLEERIAPTGTPSESQPVNVNKNEMMPASYMDKFHNAVTRGQFKGKQKEYNEIKIKIEKALAEGNVDFSR